MTNDPTPGREKKREANEDLRWSRMERGYQRGFLRTRDRRHVEDAGHSCSRALRQVILFHSILQSAGQTVGGPKYRGELANSNMAVSVYLTREWIYNLVRWPLLRCDNFLRALFIFRVLIATDWIAPSFTTEDCITGTRE